MLSSIYEKLTPYQGAKHIIVQDQQVGDIITNLLRTHNLYAREYDKIAGSFERKNVKAICQNIWQFIKTNIPYKIESDDRQLLKSPSAILYTANSTGSDCKNYSLFTAGILDALKRKGYPINWCYRFASYRFNDKLPHHVFVVVNPNTANEIWIDAVLPTFNLKKQYFYKTDKTANMALIAMSGVEYESIGASKKRTQKKAAKAVKKAAKKAAKATAPKKKGLVKKIAAGAKKAIKKAGKIVVKFAPVTVAVRNSFLALVRLNVRSVATNLRLAIAKNPAEVKKFWEGAGGSYNSLVKAVNAGAKKKRLGLIGVAPAGVPAAVAAATPLLLKVVALFKKLGIKAEDVAGVASKALKQIAQKKLDAINEAAETGEEQTSAGTFDAGSEAENLSEMPSAASNEGSTEASAEESADTEGNAQSFGGISKNTLLIGGAALAGIYLLSKSKKRG